MKRGAFETFKFGQNKTSKQTYFPAMKVEQDGTTSTPGVAPAKRAQRSNPSRKRPVQT